jgi:hypothetical protein
LEELEVEAEAITTALAEVGLEMEETALAELLPPPALAGRDDGIVC